jgi:hypothetical protein
MAEEEITQEKIGGPQVVPIFLARPRSDFILGEKKIRIGLSEPAMRLVKLIQKGDANSYPAHFIEYFQEDIESLCSLAEESPNIVLRKDGVLAELIE